MQEVCDVYKFGKVEKNVFKCCGRDVVKDKNGIHITCPNLIDRVRPIYLTAEERKKKEAKITEVHRQQLRSIIGSLAWLARMCRPDLAFEDIRYANTVIAIAHKTRTAGIHYPLRAFRFEDAVIIGLQDSSFANDHDVNSEGKKLGFRSQIGSPEFKETKQGSLLLLNWHSVTIKRVCRPTLQAETMSLIFGGGRTREDDDSWIMSSTKTRWTTMANRLWMAGTSSSSRTGESWRRV